MTLKKISILMLTTAITSGACYAAAAPAKTATAAPSAKNTTVVKKNDTGVDTIFSALESAYQNNPELAAEITKVNQADEGMVQAKAGYRPKVDGTVSVGATNTINGGELKSIGFNTIAEQQSVPTTSAGINVSQNLYQGGATIASVKGAADQKASREEFRYLPR